MPDPRDPVHLELLLAYAGSVYDSAGISAAMQTVEDERVAPGAEFRRRIRACSSTEDCWSIAPDREDLAIVTLTQAYRASADTAAPEAHIMSADNLSLVMRSMGDYSQALALNQEKIDWDAAHDAPTSLSRVALHARPDPQGDGRLPRLRSPSSARRAL